MKGACGKSRRVQVRDEVEDIGIGALSDDRSVGVRKERAGMEQNHIGGRRLDVLVQTPRCVMTTLAQGDAPADRDVLRSIAQHNTVDIGFGVFPCLGVYADVGSGGDINIGDPVMLD